jgi:hypothetical protein
MIRNLMFGMSLLALTGASAIAAPVTTHHSKTTVVAQAPAADAPAPATDKPAKKAKKSKKAKDDSAKMENKAGTKTGEAPKAK